MKDKRLAFLITSGPTREYLDPVRFFSNASSGSMGAALARAALQRRHRVVFISGPAAAAAPKGVRLVRVVSAREMFSAARRHFGRADIIIAAAAVADYRPRRVSRHKIKKSAAMLRLELVPNPDILAFLGRKKGRRTIVGFALESRAVETNARKKMKEKRCDLMVANTPEAIGSSRSAVKIFRSDGSGVVIGTRSKDLVAQRIIDEAVRAWRNSAAE